MSQTKHTPARMFVRSTPSDRHKALHSWTNNNNNNNNTMNNIDRRRRVWEYAALLLAGAFVMALGWTIGSEPQGATAVALGRDKNNKQQLLSILARDDPKTITKTKTTATANMATTTTTTPNMTTADTTATNTTTSHGPLLIWLMSFPNSGTSFTSRLVRHVSNLSTASNYGLESIDNATNSSLPLYQQGPYWTNLDAPHPTEYVLTKTHCGGKCDVCGPSHWLENPHSFKVACLSGSGLVRGRRVDVRYDEALVKKAVHLIRNPFDNVVSRFHLELHEHAERGYASSRGGFRAFCGHLDRAYRLEESETHVLDAPILNRLQDVPCHSDFIRYVQWHDLAFVTTLDMEAFVLHYELYETHLNATVMALMNFLELPLIRADDVEFIKGKEYTDYFTAKEREAVKLAVQELALTITWDNVMHYFD